MNHAVHSRQRTKVDQWCTLGGIVLALFQGTVLAASISVGNLFSPSGFMGDGEFGQQFVTQSGADRTDPHSPPSSTRVEYVFGTKRWAGVYWLNIADNWGDHPGVDLSSEGLTRLTFWAKGDTGTEIVEFKAGGIANASKLHSDSFAVTSGRLLLTKEWKEYHLDLSTVDLCSVIGAFSWVASADYNRSSRIVFCLDDIELE